MRTIRLLFIILSTMLIGIVPVNGHILYLAGSYTMGATIDVNSEFNNGASSSDFGFAVGHYFGNTGIEFLYKNLNMEDDHTTDAGTFDITITDKVYGFQFRFPLQQYGVIKLGYGLHSVKAVYDLRDSSQIFRSKIDGVSSGIIFGFGFKVPFYAMYEYYTDFEFMHIGNDLNFAALEIGIRIIF